MFKRESARNPLMVYSNNDKCPKCNGNLYWTMTMEQGFKFGHTRCQYHPTNTTIHLIHERFCDFEGEVMYDIDGGLIYGYYPLCVDQMDLPLDEK